MSGKLILPLILLFGLAAPAYGEPLPLPARGESFWGLGATKILCYQEPCPRHGVFRINRDGTFDLPLVRRDQRRPPPLRADDRARARIERAFATGGCVVAEAHFEGRTLIVRRVLGNCHDW